MAQMNTESSLMDCSKQVLIAGINSDLGRVLARELSKDGSVKVVGSTRLSAGQLANVPAAAIIYDCDLTVASRAEELSNEAGTHFDGPFGYVHCVGNFCFHESFRDLSPTQAADMFRSHVETLYNAIHAIQPIMEGLGGGSVVAFSCNSVKYNYPLMAAFTAAKSAVESLTRSLANELSGAGVRMNALQLASLKTQKVIESKPHGDHANFVCPNEVVPIVRFLLSAEARLLNGSVMNVFQHSPGYYRSGYFQRVAP